MSISFLVKNQWDNEKEDLSEDPFKEKCVSHGFPYMWTVMLTIIADFGLSSITKENLSHCGKLKGGNDFACPPGFGRTIFSLMTSHHFWDFHDKKKGAVIGFYFSDKMNSFKWMILLEFS